MGAAIFGAGALLLIAVGGTAAFFIVREPDRPRSSLSSAPAASEPTARPPLNINGVMLKDGSDIDPTDLIHVVRARIADGASPSDVALLGISVSGARLGKVDLDDGKASITYDYLVTHRDPRAAKADERKAERVAFTLRADAPAVQRAEEKVNVKTVPEPTCVWSAAWRAAIASGLSDKDFLDVTYGTDEKGKDTVWTFAVPERPETRRIVDGDTCAIKLSK